MALFTAALCRFGPAGRAAGIAAARTVSAPARFTALAGDFSLLVFIHRCESTITVVICHIILLLKYYYT